MATKPSPPNATQNIPVAGAAPLRRRGRSCLRRLALGALVVLLGGLALHYRGSLATAFEACSRAGHAPRITTLRAQGGRVDWLAARDLIAYDQLTDSGSYAIFTMHPDGSDDRCLTCGASALPAVGHKGNPAWHPSGEYIVFQAEKPHDKVASYQATPGFGARSDLWLATADATRFFRLTNTPDDDNSGVLHPHFSADGKRLMWSQMYAAPNVRERAHEFGLWHMMVADFALGPDGPQLSNAQQFAPLGPAFYETHDFSPDGRHLLFSSNARKERLFSIRNHIYLLALDDGALTQLTFDGYSEHAHFAHDGKYIAWMWNRDNLDGSTDLWLMRPDGSNQVRLTYYNHTHCPEHEWRPLTVSDSSWGPEDDRIVAFVATDLVRQIGRIDLIEFEAP